MQIVNHDASCRLESHRQVLGVAGWIAWGGMALWGLHDHWSANSQYTFGWVVFPLAALLAWRRWLTRPQPAHAPGWAFPLLTVSAALLLPAWIIAQPNAAWRLIPWLLTASFAGGSVGTIALLGGRPWAWHFAFPIFFILTAVPWPGFIEAPLVQGLMRFVAEVTVVILNATNIPALQRGNLVEISNGVLGIDEACSGVRSLQATFMVALFLGELHRLRTGARVSLVAIAFATAIVTNIGRTWLLSQAAATRGMNAAQGFHDPAGYTIFTICLVIIAFTAELLRRHHSEIARAPSPEASKPFPRGLGLALCTWVVIVFAGTEAWYRSSRTSQAPLWTVAPPAGARSNPVSPEALALLACDRQESAVWEDDSGARWTLFFFEWVPGTGRSAILARVHRPEICLPGAGLHESAPRGAVNVSAAGFQLHFESLQFSDARGENVFVFFCPWEFAPGTTGRNVTFSDATRLASLERVWRRERWLGQQTLEMIVTGYRDREQAEAALRQQVSAILRRGDEQRESGSPTRPLN